MANRVYLYCTDSTSMPSSSDEDSFFTSSGKEYEAKACIPLYWLCLFGEDDIRTTTLDNSDNVDAEPYAYLITERKKGLDRLIKRLPLIEKIAGESRVNLYRDWISRLMAEPFAQIIVCTEELSWFWFGQPGGLEQDLRAAINNLDRWTATLDFTMTHKLANIIGLQEGQEISDCESFELVGTCNSNESWPPRFFQEMRNPKSPDTTTIAQPKLNLGILTLFIAFIIYLVTNLIVDALMGTGYYSNAVWPVIVATCLAAGTIGIIGYKLNRSGVGPSQKHHFLWLPMEYWSLIIFALGIYAAIK